MAARRLKASAAIATTSRVASSDRRAGPSLAGKVALDRQNNRNTDCGATSGGLRGPGRRWGARWRGSAGALGGSAGREIARDGRGSGAWLLRRYGGAFGPA